MRHLHLDAATGVAGDMTLAALLDLGAEEAVVAAAVDSLGLDGVELVVDEVKRKGFRAKHVTVRHPEQHAHRHLRHVEEIIARGDLTDGARAHASDMFGLVAVAEAKVHGMTVEKVHFHEVGAVDSIVDIVGVAVAIDSLGIESISCSPVPVGRGTVTIAHGVCPLPAPATAEILTGVPLADVPVEAELTTPTGAAIVRTFATSFGPLPPLAIERIGYGAGTREFADRANILRLILGQSATSAVADGLSREPVVELVTQVDDVTGEVLGHAASGLLAAGALDVAMASLVMKKGRPGTELSVLARPEDADRLEAMVFAETGTFGVRRRELVRTVRDREVVERQTPDGPIRFKRGGGPGGGETPEFDDCVSVARASGETPREVYRRNA
ncbi:MAG: nickel pincer cofactor biosynthesis protein LarC [Planctomycetota bacterium]